jgi:hypothetical protein
MLHVPAAAKAGRGVRSARFLVPQKFALTPDSKATHNPQQRTEIRAVRLAFTPRVQAMSRQLANGFAASVGGGGVLTGHSSAWMTIASSTSYKALQGCVGPHLHDFVRHWS